MCEIWGYNYSWDSYTKLLLLQRKWIILVRAGHTHLFCKVSIDTDSQISTSFVTIWIDPVRNQYPETTIFVPPLATTF